MKKSQEFPIHSNSGVATIRLLQHENIALHAEVARLKRSLTELEKENVQLRREIMPSGQALPKSCTTEASIDYEALFDSHPVPLVIFRPDGLMVAINLQNEKLLQISREQLVGKYNLCKDPAALQTGHVDYFQRALAGEFTSMPPTRYHIHQTPLQGIEQRHVIWTQTSYFPLRDHRGAVRHVVGMNMDVSRYKQVDEERQHLNTELQQNRSNQIHFRC